MYVFPVGNNVLLLNRDDKRVGRYMELDRVPAPIRVSRDVRKISITKTVKSDFYNLLTKALEESSSQDDIEEK